MTAQTFALTQEATIHAPRALVYEFFTTPELLMRWMGVAAEVNPVVGGAMIVNVTGQDITRGEFIELVPNERLVFSWGFTQAGASRVTVTLTSPPGQPEHTHLRLHHAGFTEQDNCDAHDAGWEHYLKRLPLAVEGKPVGIDSRVRVPTSPLHTT